MPRKDGLTARERRFADAWLRNPNGTKAHIAAGYKAKSPAAQSSAACLLLKKPSIKTYIRNRLEKSEEESLGEIRQVARELRAVLLVDPDEAFDDENCFKPMNEWPQELRRAVASIELKELYESAPDGGQQLIGYLKKVKFWSKTEAAKQLLQHLGGFAPTKIDANVNLEDLVMKTQEPTE